MYAKVLPRPRKPRLRLDKPHRRSSPFAGTIGFANRFSGSQSRGSRHRRSETKNCRRYHGHGRDYQANVAAAAKLAEDLTGAVASSPKTLPSASRARLAQELVAVLNPSKFPQAKMAAIFDDVQAIFQENGADRKHASAIADDLKTLQAK